MVEITSPMTLGVDPEIGYMKDGQQVVATKFIKNCAFGVGLDGHNDISEIRLKGPVKTPREIVTEIRGYFKELAPKIPKDVIVVAGGMAGTDPLGGHIHFGNTKFTKFADMWRYGEKLDLYLAFPVLMLENAIQAKARRCSNYGKLFIDRDQGAIETKAYGGFEYRTLSSYLVSPSFTESIIALGHTIVHEVDYGNAKLKSLKQFQKVNDLRTAFNNGDKKVIMKYIPKVFEDIQECMLFKNNYKKQLAGLFGLIKAFGIDNKDWFAEKDILIRWGARNEPGKKVEETKEAAPPEPVVVQEEAAVFPLTYAAGDIHMGDIMPRLANLRYRVQIYLYGIRDSHSFDFVYQYTPESARIAPQIQLNLPSGMRTTDAIICSENGSHIYLGLSKTVRSNPSNCVRIVQHMLQPYQLGI